MMSCLIYHIADRARDAQPTNQATTTTRICRDGLDGSAAATVIAAKGRANFNAIRVTTLTREGGVVACTQGTNRIAE